MALTFADNTSNNVSAGDSSSVQNLTAVSGAMWVYLTGTPSDYLGLMGKGTFGAQNRKDIGIVPAGGFEFVVDRATTDARNVSNETLTVNAWNYIAFTYSESDGIDLYLGSLTAAAVECTYSTSGAGSGSTMNDNGSNWRVGNIGLNDRAAPTRIASVQLYNRRLTLAEIVSLQFRPSVLSGCVVYYQLGYNGTGTQPDWSGNGNNGTVTGATVGDHVPLMAGFGFASALPYVVADSSEPALAIHIGRRALMVEVI